MDISDKHIALGVGGAVAACCTVHLVVLAGGLGAVGGLAGSLLTNPYLLVGGLIVLAAAAVTAALSRRAGRIPSRTAVPRPRTSIRSAPRTAGTERSRR